MKIVISGFSAERKVPALVAAFLLTTAIIIIISQFPVRTPAALPQTLIDKAIPCVPCAVYIYLAYFPFVFLALYFLKDRENINRVAASMILATVLTWPIFLLVPTISPPNILPRLTGLTGLIFGITYRANLSLYNVFPSMHTGYSYLAALGYRDEQRRWYFPVLGFATLIALSTLLTKQHYFIDVLGGLALAWGCRFLTDHCIEFRFQNVAELDINDYGPDEP